MGYHTGYHLTVEPPITGDKIEKDLDLLNYGELDDENLEEGDLGRCSSSWYGHEDEMREFSEMYPDHLFELGGCGENSEDIWIKYFKNGKMQHCPAIITFDEYDEGKLE